MDAPFHCYRSALVKRLPKVLRQIGFDHASLREFGGFFGLIPSARRPIVSCKKVQTIPERQKAKKGGFGPLIQRKKIADLSRQIPRRRSIGRARQQPRPSQTKAALGIRS